MAAGNKEIGRWGEDVACDMLVGLGYAIVERNWRVGHLEIDIVAQKGGRIAFVEVKTRTADSPEDPLDAIDRRKQAHMAAAANAFLRGNHWRGEVRSVRYPWLSFRLYCRTYSGCVPAST